MDKKGKLITAVNSDSIAFEAGIKPGDKLLSINGQNVNDIIDYKYLISDEYIEVSINREDQEWIFEIDKEYDEDLGIIFEKPIIDKANRCTNRCIFCFIDQLPPNMRKTLYFKDDDSRLSFLHGNFITLTNMSQKDIERIIKYRISPLNISVHTTNPDLRIKMLGNKRAGNILQLLKKFVNGGIQINCQIVLCRDINDGEELKKTVIDLYSLYPGIKNVAVVPVGITKYRQDLYPLLSFDYNTSNNVINIIEELEYSILKKSKKVFVRAADEFYIMADRQLKNHEFYGNYEQLEDGVGMITCFIQNIKKSLDNLKINKINREISIITGESASRYIKDMCSLIESKIKGISISVHMIKNDFFGEKITVTGLLTGKDITEQLEGIKLGDVLMIPSNILKYGEHVLLDDMTVEELEKKLNIKTRICKFDGSDFIENIVL